MKRRAKISGVLFLFCMAGLSSLSWAQVAYPDAQAATAPGERYVLLVVGGSNASYQRSYMVTKTPALVLDTYLGIVWRCRNLQDDRPLWVKTDLAKLKDKASTARRFIIKTLDYFGTEPKVPAVVLDVEQGRVWTCSNILDEASVWAQKDLVQDAPPPEEKYKY